MKRTALVVGLSLALAAPVALAAPPTTTGPASPAAGKPETKPVTPQAKGKAKTLYLIRACVTADATSDSVSIEVLSSNAHARKAGAVRKAAFNANIATAKVALVGKARVQQGTKIKLKKEGDYTSLTKGDFIVLRARVARGTDATAVSWTSVVDNGPIRPKLCPTTTPAAPAPAT